MATAIFYSTDGAEELQVSTKPQAYRSRRAPGTWLRHGGDRPGLTEPPARPVLGRLTVLAMRAFGRLPLRLVQGIGAGLAWLLAVLPTRERRISEVNLEIAFPRMPARERARLARRSMVATGRTFAEIAAVWAWKRRSLERFVTRVSGEQPVAEAIASGRGVILAAPHLGDWEVVGLYCSSRYPMTTLYRQPRIRELERFIRESRGRFGADMVPAGPGAARRLLKALRQGRLVAILPDQDAGEGAGVFVPFFGELANTMVLLPRLAARTGALVVLGYAERLPRGAGFHLHFVPACSGVGDENLARAAGSMNADVERLVRALPEQYLWSYKRFRIRPPGAEDPYRRSSSRA